MARTPEETRALNTERMRRWRAANPERVKAHCLAWNKAHREKARQKTIEWRAAHPNHGREYREKNRERLRVRNAEWRARHKERVRDLSLRKKYGIALGVFDSLMAAQKGLCAICGDPLQRGHRTHVDHDHATHKVRALLCRHCNLILGYAKDQPSRLRAAILYLEGHHAVARVAPLKEGPHARL